MKPLAWPILPKKGSGAGTKGSRGSEEGGVGIPSATGGAVLTEGLGGTGGGRVAGSCSAR